MAKLGIGIGVRIDDIKKVKTSLETQINNIKGLKVTIKDFNIDDESLSKKLQGKMNSLSKNLKLKISGVELDEASTNKLQTQLNKISKNTTAKISKIEISDKATGTLQSQLNKAMKGLVVKVGNVEFDVTKIDTLVNKTKQATQEAKQYKNVMGKSLNIGDGSKAFDAMQKKANDIRKTVDSLAKISFTTGKNGGIDTATLSYTNNIGKLVTETMGWKKVTTDAGKTVQNIFTTLGTKVTEDVEKLTRLETKFTEIKSKMQGKLNLAGSMGMDTSFVAPLQQALNSLKVGDIKGMNQLERQITSLTGNVSNIKKLENTITNLSRRINDIKSNDKKMDIISSSELRELESAEKNVQNLKRLLAEQKSGKVVDGALIEREVAGARNSVAQLSSSINNANSNGKGLLTTFKNIFNYTVGGSAIFLAFNQLKQGLSDITAIDTAMRDLKRVSSDVQNSVLNGFTQEANQMGIALGSTTEGYIKAVATFKQLGYEWKDAKDFMAQKSTILANVGDMSAGDSANAIVATLKGFQLEAKDTTTIVDSLNEAGNKFAITTGDLAEGLRVSSASLALANNDLYQSEALITAGTEVLRDANTVGNGLKTISMRLDQVKTKGGETFYKLKDDLKELANTDLTKADGSLRSTYDIILDLSKAWKSGNLSDMDKSQLLDETAGKQQAKVMASILQNAEKLPEIYEAMKNSAGSAEQEQARYMDSIEGKLNAFKETMKSVWVNAIDSESIKAILTGVTLLAGGLSNIINLFGALPVVISGVVGAMTIMNESFRKAMSFYQPTFITNWVSKLGTLRTAYASQISIQKENIVALRNYITAQEQAGASTLGLKGKLASMQLGLIATTVAEGACAVGAIALQAALTMGLSFAITAIVSGLSSLATSSEDASAKMTDLATSMKQEQDSIASAQKLLSEKTKLEEQLAESTEGTEENTKLKTELLDVERQIADVLPQSTSGFDAEGKAISANTDLILAQITAKREKLALDAKELLQEAGDVNKTVKTAELTQKQITAVKLAQAQGNPVANIPVSLTTDEKMDIRYTEDYVSRAEKKLIEYNSTIANTRLAILQLKASGFSDEDIQSMFPTIDPTSVTDYTKALADNSKAQQENTVKRVESAGVDDGTGNAIELEEAKTKAVEKATSAYSESASSIAKAQGYLDKLNKSGEITPTLAGQISKSYKDVGTNINNVSTLQDFLTKKIQGQQLEQQKNYEIMVGDDEAYYQEKIANSKEFQASYESALNEFNLAGEQAYDVDFSKYKTLNELKNATQNGFGAKIKSWLGQYVSANSSAYQLDFGSFKSFAEAKAKILAKLQVDIAMVTLQMNNAITSAKKYSDMVANGTTEEDGMGTNSKGEKAFVPTSNEAKRRASANANYAGKLQGDLDGLNTAYDKVNTSFDEFSGKTASFDGGNIGSDFSGTGGDAKKSAEDAKKLAEEIKKMTSAVKPDVYFELNNAIKSIDNELNINRELMSTLTEGTVAYQKAQEDQIALEERKQVALENLNKEQKKQANTLKDYLTQYGFTMDEMGNLTNSQSQIQYWQDITNAMGGNTEQAKAKKQEWIDWIKELGDKTKDYSDLVNDKIPSVTAQWKELGDQIRKTAKEELGSLRDDIKDALSQDYEAKQDAKMDKIDEAYDKKKKRLEKEYEDDRENLEAEKEAEVQDYQDEIDALQEQLDDLNDDSDEKKEKLAKLKSELSKWNLDDSVFADNKKKELTKEIADLEKDITKDSLQDQIDALTKKKDASSDSHDEELKALEDSNKEELQEAEDYYNKQKKKYEDYYEKKLKDKNLYEEADKLITSNSQEEMLTLLGTYNEKYKDVGTLLGENFREGFKEQIAGAMEDFKKLTGESATGSSGGDSSSGDIKVGDSVKVSNLSSDAIANVSQGSAIDLKSGGTWGNYVDSGSKLKTVGYDNGYFQIAKDGQVLGWARRDDLAEYETGGRTPDNIGSNGAIAKLHGGEKILNKEDTIMTDRIFQYVNQTMGLLKNVNGMLGNYNPSDSLSTNTPSVSSNISNLSTSQNTNSNVSLQNTINVTNNTKDDSYFNAKSLDRLWKNQTSRFS